jgi:general secretion pathway protein J
MTITRANRKSRAGFTLLEVVISIAMIGAIVGCLATMTAQWLPNWNRDFDRVQRNELLALGLERVVADLAAAEFVPVVRGRPQLMFDGENRSVFFVGPRSHRALALGSNSCVWRRPAVAMDPCW